MAKLRRTPVPAGRKPAPAATTAPAVVAPVVDASTPPPAAPPPSGQDGAGVTASGETGTALPVATTTIAGLLPAPSPTAPDASSMIVAGAAIVPAVAPVIVEPAPAPVPGDVGAAIVSGETPATAPVVEDEDTPPADVDARVLVAFGDLAVNDIATASPSEIERLVNAGMVDPHPDAVAAARELTA